MIDPEKLFSAFELPQPEEGDLLAELQKTQTFKLGMFKKIILMVMQENLLHILELGHI